LSNGETMKKMVYLIIIFYIIQATIHNLGHPVTPAFVRELGIQDYMFGVFFASMSFGLMLGGPIWGVLSDQGKKKIYIVFGLLLYSIGQFFFAYSNNQYLMVFFRFLSGFGVASAITIFTSHVISISEPNDRAKHLAYTAAAFTLGASLGYWIGGFLSTNSIATSILGTSDFRIIFLIQSLLNTLYVVLIIFVFKEAKKIEPILKKVTFFKALKQVTKIEPSLLIFLISLTFMTIGSMNVSRYIDVYFNELGYNPQQLGTFVMATGLVSLFASIFIVPIFSKFKKQLVTISIIHILSALIIFYVFRANQFLLVMYTIFMVYVIFKAIYQPLEQSYISLQAKEEKYGTVMGIRQSFVSIGMVLGPLIGGFIYERSPLLLFDFSGIFFILGVLLLGIVYLLEKRKKLILE
jgi:MFS family permease